VRRFFPTKFLNGSGRGGNQKGRREGRNHGGKKKGYLGVLAASPILYSSSAGHRAKEEEKKNRTEKKGGGEKNGHCPAHRRSYPVGFWP